MHLFDFETNEGIAEGAVLRFLGVPILAMPVLSFPLTDARKSGWLPPSVNLDNKSGLELAVPYYWNIAPQRDATLTPIAYTRRGAGLIAEGRYLEPRHGGELQWHELPNDRVFGAERHALRWRAARAGQHLPQLAQSRCMADTPAGAQPGAIPHRHADESMAAASVARDPDVQCRQRPGVRT